MGLESDSTMPFGKYYGKKMSEIPEHYLIWIYERKKCNWEVRNYIFDNIIYKREMELKAQAALSEK